MTISERLFKIMEEREITQYRLSKLTGISLQTINDWKKKNTNPSSDKIMIICECLDITPEELLIGKLSTSSRNDYSFSSSAEATLIELYRNLPESQQKRLFAYLAMLTNSKKKN